MSSDWTRTRTERAAADMLPVPVLKKETVRDRAAHRGLYQCGRLQKLSFGQRGRALWFQRGEQDSLDADRARRPNEDPHLQRARPDSGLRLFSAFQDGLLPERC